MKVHTLQIPAEGKRLEGEEDAHILDLHDPGIQPSSHIAYTLDVGLSDGGLFATGSLAAEFDMQCVTCLERFPYSLKIEDFACQVELTNSETVDLTEPVREDILLALPAHPHCDWNGEKDCKGAFHPASENDESLAHPEIWGALDQLKIEKTS